MTPCRHLLLGAFSSLLIAGITAAQAQHDHTHNAATTHRSVAASQEGCPFNQDADSATAPTGGLPTSPGPGVFGAIGEIVALLESDPATDWSRVAISRLREHLLDMNELVLRAETREQAVPEGVVIEITGQGRAREAIGRMVPAHASMMRSVRPWQIAVEDLENGVRLTLTSSDPREAEKLRGLGFFGFMASDDHHQPHHLAIARGSM